MKRFFLAIVCSLLAIAPGCGPSTEVAGPVATGIVTLDGEPLPSVSLVFYPTGQGSSASAVVGKDGTFEVKTAASATGIAPGEYKVVVLRPDGAGENVPDIPEVYTNEEITDRKVTITEEGPNELKVELTTNPEGWPI